MGPKGMDKMLVSQDGDVTVTNDGATIVENMNIEHPIAKLLVELSKSQDDESGDGTTGVVVLAGALLEQAQKLLDKGIHPLKIIEGFDKACEYALEHLESIATEINLTENDNENLKKAAKTALCSKVVSKYQEQFAKIAVDAILSVADLERKDVNFDMIKVEGKVGGNLGETQLIGGIVIDKEMSHPQMVKKVEDAKICILNIPFEPPKPKSKYNIDIKSAEDYKKLYETEQNYFKTANHLLMHNNLPSVRWVGGSEIEQIALATGGRIINNFSEIKKEKLGSARVIKEITVGTKNQKMIVIEDCPKKKAVTILVRGGSSMIVDEAKRCLHDALCVVRNMLKNNKIVYGGGATEVACALYVADKADNTASIDQYAIRAFAEALEVIPISLAENSGYNGIEYLANLKAKQKKENNPCYGVDCSKEGTMNMMTQGVYEGFNAKKQQLQLATQVCKMILKIDDVIKPHDLDEPAY